MVTKAEVKEIIQDYVLIVYDIPQDAKKLRAKFLKEAKVMGAEKQTDSSYYLPYSKKAMELANQLESAGHAVVFGPAHQPNKEKALQMTTKYHQHLQARCDYISQRLVICQEYLAQGKLGVAKRMGIKTGKLLAQLTQIAESFSPDWLKPRIEELVAQWKEIYGGK